LGSVSSVTLWSGVVMLWFTLLINSLLAVQARVPRAHDSLRSRLLIGALCWAQPIVRSWARYKKRYFWRQRDSAEALGGPIRRFNPLVNRIVRAYWGVGIERLELLKRAIDIVRERHCGQTIDTGWSSHDFEVFWDAWTVVQVCTVQEELGSDRRVIRLSCHLRLSKIGKTAAALGCAATLLCVPIGATVSVPIAVVSVSTIAALWWSGARLMARLVELFDQLAGELQLVRCDAKERRAGGARNRLEPVEAAT
jgi:hypothetical protein